LWDKLINKFRRRKAGFEIARLMLESGMRIGADGHYYIGDIRVADSAISDALKINRQIVRDTAEFILEDVEIGQVFTKLKPSGSNLVEAASVLGLRALVIEANPNNIGVVSAVMKVFGDLGIMVHQAIVDDVELYPEPRITILYKGGHDEELIKKLSATGIVRSINIKNDGDRNG